LDYESQDYIYYKCPDDEETPGSGRCIFHDKNYLKEDKDNRKEHEQIVRDRLMDKISNSVDLKVPLFCIDYHLPDITIRELNFSKPVYFTNCEFQGKADFTGAIFQGPAYFFEATGR
jgi:hypothetical protein